MFYFAQAQICFISWESNNARVSCCLSAASWWWPLAGPGGARPCGLAVLSRPGLPGARLTELVAIDQVTHKHTSSLWTASISAKKQVRLRRKSFMAFHKTTKWQSDHPWADYWWTTVRNFMYNQCKLHITLYIYIYNTWYNLQISKGDMLLFKKSQS